MLAAGRLVATLALALSAGCESTSPADLGGDGTGAVAGLLLDEADRPLGGAQVQACSPTVCLYVDTGSDGRFRIGELPIGERFVLKVLEDLEARPRRGEALQPFVPTAGATVDAGRLWVPTLPTVATLAAQLDRPQAVAAGEGVTVVVTRGALDPPLGADTSLIGARRLDAARRPRLDVGTAKVAEVVVFLPFGMASAAPIPARVRSSLAVGTKVSLRAMSELDGTLGATATGRVAADGWAASDEGQGIDRLTLLVVTAP